jgi:hypothetical protein
VTEQIKEYQSCFSSSMRLYFDEPSGTAFDAGNK